jgi:hypothetical protein
MKLLIFIFDAEFLDFLKIGWDHIIDKKAYDHLLFIMVLCAVFTFSEWRKILVLVTAFTIGHSLTLALSALNFVDIPSVYIDVLIPFSILITAFSNILRKQNNGLVSKAFESKVIVNYLIALSFGLIHGLGFANNFKFLMGEESSITKQLFAFNTGLELGQITVVLFLMGALWLLTKVFKLLHRDWTLFISGAGAGISTMMIIDAISEGI